MTQMAADVQKEIDPWYLFPNICGHLRQLRIDSLFRLSRGFGQLFDDKLCHMVIR